MSSKWLWGIAIVLVAVVLAVVLWPKKKRADGGDSGGRGAANARKGKGAALAGVYAAGGRLIEKGLGKLGDNWFGESSKSGGSAASYSGGTLAGDDNQDANGAYLA